MSNCLFFFCLFVRAISLYKFFATRSDIFALLPFLWVILVIIFDTLDFDKPQNLAFIRYISGTSILKNQLIFILVLFAHIYEIFFGLALNKRQVKTEALAVLNLNLASSFIRVLSCLIYSNVSAFIYYIALFFQSNRFSFLPFLVSFFAYANPIPTYLTNISV